MDVECKNLLDIDGNRLLCRESGSDEHFEIYHKVKNLQMSVQDKIEGGISATNVVEELVRTIEYFSGVGDGSAEAIDTDSHPASTNHLASSSAWDLFAELQEGTGEDVESGEFDEVDGTIKSFI